MIIVKVDIIYREVNGKISIRFCMSNIDGRKEWSNIIK